MKKIFALFLSTILLVSAYAQTKSIQSTPPLSEASPRSIGISGERLARIDSMLINSIAENRIPGVVALIARNGKIVYHKSFGMADHATNRMLKRDDIFRISSQTKAITSTAVMMLWEEGKFRLDDPIANYLPEFKNAKVLDTLYEDGTYDTKPADKHDRLVAACPSKKPSKKSPLIFGLIWLGVLFVDRTFLRHTSS